MGDGTRLREHLLRQPLFQTCTVSIMRAALFALFGASLALSSGALAQDSYPSRPVRIVVNSAPGGGTDIAARLIGQWLSERLSQQFIIDNRVGFAGNIAAEAVVRAPADGYTLLMVGAPNAINATLYDNLNFNFIRDFAPVAGIMRVPLVMVTNRSFPAKTVPEFIAHAKANPRRINMGSAGIGSTSHLAGELFKSMAGVDLIHVPYRGNAPALTEVTAGRVDMIFDQPASSNRTSRPASSNRSRSPRGTGCPPIPMSPR